MVGIVDHAIYRLVVHGVLVFLAVVWTAMVAGPHLHPPVSAVSPPYAGRRRSTTGMDGVPPRKQEPTCFLSGQQAGSLSSSDLEGDSTLLASNDLKRCWHSLQVAFNQAVVSLGSARASFVRIYDIAYSSRCKHTGR